MITFKHLSEFPAVEVTSNMYENVGIQPLVVQANKIEAHKLCQLVKHSCPSLFHTFNFVQEWKLIYFSTLRWRCSYAEGVNSML